MRVYVLIGMSWDFSFLSFYGRRRTRMRTMKRMTKRNESYFYKIVICRMCVIRRFGEGGRKRFMIK